MANPNPPNKKKRPAIEIVQDEPLLRSVKVKIPPGLQRIAAAVDLITARMDRYINDPVRNGTAIPNAELFNLYVNRVNMEYNLAKLMHDYYDVPSEATVVPSENKDEPKRE